MVPLTAQSSGSFPTAPSAPTMDEGSTIIHPPLGKDTHIPKGCPTLYSSNRIRSLKRNKTWTKGYNRNFSTPHPNRPSKDVAAALANDERERQVIYLRGGVLMNNIPV